MTKSETKLHDSEIYISHSITKTLRNDAHLSLIGLRGGEEGNMKKI